MTSDPNKPIVLLIDDSPDVHRLIRVRLRHEPIEVVSANGGAEGLATAKQIKPATILLDLDMPGMDGFEVLRALKRDPELANTPVIVLSGMSEADDKVTAFDLGAADYVTKSFEKPSDLAELRARLRASLRVERLLRLLAERAELDGLTGLGNRVQFNRRWSQEVAGNQRYGKALSLALFDIDHFKRINDTYGHPAGDAVLMEFAKQLFASCRQTDVACRLGGEEFALIMTETALEGAAQVADRVRQGLMATRWPRHPEHVVTVSAGVIGATTGANGATPELWFEAADKALYAAKHGGRNRVVTGAAENLAPAVKA